MTKQFYKPLANIGLKALSSTELEYMKRIWTAPEGISSEDICNCFPQHAIQTRRVILHNILKKGYIHSIRQGKHVAYYPNVSQEDYENAVREQEFEKRFGGSLEDVVAAFCGKKKLTEEQIDRLNTFIEELCDETMESNDPNR